MPFVQATAIAVGGRGVLLFGPPGCGKSDLALRMIGRGATLIGDDGVGMFAQDHRLVIAPVAVTTVRLHVVGIGMVEIVGAGAVPAALAVQLDPAAQSTDRLVTLGAYGPVDGMHLPQIALPALHASTPDKLLLALERWGH